MAIGYQVILSNAKIKVKSEIVSDLSEALRWYTLQEAFLPENIVVDVLGLKKDGGFFIVQAAKREEVLKALLWWRTTEPPVNTVEEYIEYIERNRS